MQRDIDVVAEVAGDGGAPAETSPLPGGAGASPHEIDEPLAAAAVHERAPEVHAS